MMVVLSGKILDSPYFLFTLFSMPISGATQVFWVDLQGVGVQLENLPIERESENASGLQLFL